MPCFVVTSHIYTRNSIHVYSSTELQKGCLITMSSVLVWNCFTHCFYFCLFVCMCVFVSNQLAEKTQRIEALELDLKTTQEHLQSFQNEVEYIVMISRPTTDIQRRS